MPDYRKQFSLDAESAAILDALDGNRASAYVREAIKRVHALDLTDDAAYELGRIAGNRDTVDLPLATAASALETLIGEGMQSAQYLTSCGWSGGECLAVMQAMMGTWISRGPDLGMAIALEMSDAARLGTVDLDAWGVATERWAALVSQVREHSEIARAIVDASRLFWGAEGGSSLERAWRRGLGNG